MSFHHAARAGLNIATLTGIDSAETVLSGDLTTFDRQFDPTEIGICCEPKVFECTVSVGVN
jgi:hypothetical protein